MLSDKYFTFVVSQQLFNLFDHCSDNRIFLNNIQSFDTLDKFACIGSSSSSPSSSSTNI